MELINILELKEEVNTIKSEMMDRMDQKYDSLFIRLCDVLDRILDDMKNKEINS